MHIWHFNIKILLGGTTAPLMCGLMWPNGRLKLLKTITPDLNE